MMQYLCPKCGCIMYTVSTASIPAIIMYHCANCGFKSRPIKEEFGCEYLPKELWSEEGDDEIQHN